MVDLAKAAQTAQRLVEKHARSVTLYKANRAPADAQKPWRGPDVSAPPDDAEGGETVTALACFVPARGAGFGSDARLREGSTLKDAEQLVLISSLSLPDGTDLADFDAMRDGTKVWKIHFVGELRPADDSVLWEVGVSR